MPALRVVPEIRFKGFTAPWEPRKLGDISNAITGFPFSSKMFCCQGILLIKGANVKRGTLDLSSDITSYWPETHGYEDYIIKKHDILIQMDGALIGKSYCMYDNELPALLVQRVTRVRSSNNEYLYQYIKLRFFNYIKGLKTETAVPHLSLKDINSMDVNVTNLLEETKIGSFLNSLDNLITLHQRKCDSLKEIKKTLLNKMFPVNGASVPAIRFKGFTDVWEKRKLNDLCSEFKSGDAIMAKNIHESGDFPVYGGNGLRGFTATFNHTGFYCLIGRQGALCGNVNKSKGKAYFTEHAIAVKANISNDTGFLFYLFSIMNLGQYSGQSAQPGLAVGKLLNLNVYVPVIKEQRCISMIFDQIDNLITLYQHKVNIVQDMKQTLLAKMFV